MNPVKKLQNLLSTQQIIYGRVIGVNGSKIFVATRFGEQEYENANNALTVGSTVEIQNNTITPISPSTEIFWLP